MWAGHRLGLITGTLCLISVAIAPAVDAASDMGDAKRGKGPYQQYCAVCHGKSGLGNGPMAKATTPPASKLTVREVREMSEERLFDAIANGVGSAMPAWRGLLTDQQLLDVMAYVRSLSG